MRRRKNVSHIGLIVQLFLGQMAGILLGFYVLEQLRPGSWGEVVEVVRAWYEYS